MSTQTVLDLYKQGGSKDICNLELQWHNCISSNGRECEFLVRKTSLIFGVEARLSCCTAVCLGFFLSSSF